MLTEKQKMSQRKYAQSEKGKLNQWKKNHSEKGKARAIRYYLAHLLEIRDKKKVAQRKYNHSEKFYLNRYGLSQEEIKKIQASPCQICGREPPSVVDHDHLTRKIRGPLCFRHNSFVGFLETCSPKELKRILVWIGMGVE